MDETKIAELCKKYLDEHLDELVNRKVAEKYQERSTLSTFPFRDLDSKKHRLYLWLTTNSKLRELLTQIVAHAEFIDDNLGYTFPLGKMVVVQRQHLQGKCWVARKSEPNNDIDEAWCFPHSTRSRNPLYIKDGTLHMSAFGMGEITSEFTKGEFIQVGQEIVEREHHLLFELEEVRDVLKQ